MFFYFYDGGRSGERYKAAEKMLKEAELLPELTEKTLEVAEIFRQ